MLSGGNLTTSVMSATSQVSETIAFITIPQEISELFSPGDDISVAFTIYREANLFPVRNTNPEVRSFVGSSVISAKVAGVADGTVLNAPVIVSLVLNNESVPRPNEEVSRTCVFWDFSKGDTTFEYCVCIHILL